MDLLKKYDLWNNIDDWVDYGALDNNWSIASNQGGPIESIVEREDDTAHPDVVHAVSRKEAV